jgi:FADH2 O2-dependent halogenase
LSLPVTSFDNFPRTQGLYCHFTGVKQWADVASDGRDREWASAEPPYPVDSAAVHHVFDGGWIWVLRFNNGVTSGGVAATDDLAQELGFSEGEAAWKRLLQRIPTVRAQFEEAAPQFPFVHAPKLSFRTGLVVGTRWALLPSAGGFVDPLLSTGFPLTLLGVERLAEILATSWNSPALEQRLSRYARCLQGELDAAARLVGALYAAMNDFPLFAALSLLYFAAASFSEAARRLARPQLAEGFLLNRHPRFRAALRSCCERARRSRENRLTAAARAGLIDDIYRAIEPIDVAGVSDRSRRNWHPVAVRDLLNGAGKLEVTESDMARLLARCGFFPPAHAGVDGSTSDAVEPAGRERGL